MSKVLHVGNLTVTTTPRELRHLFSRYGTVTKADVPVHPIYGRSLCFGFVEMADGADAALDALNGAQFQGRQLNVNEALPRSDGPSEDRRSEIERFAASYDWPKNLEVRAETGSAEAAQELAEALADPGPNHDPESAYKWYYIALSQRGYTVEFEDQNLDPPHYCGPVGDFRNEGMVSDLVAELGFEKVKALDAEAERWMAERNLTKMARPKPVVVESAVVSAPGMVGRIRSWFRRR